MTSKSRTVLLVLALLIGGALSIGLLLRRPQTRPSARSAGWGTGDVKVSERVYYTSTLKRIIRHWQGEMLREASLDEDGRVEDPYHVYLIIDTSKPAVWIEQNGRVLLDNYAGLPESMIWKVYRRAPEGNTELGRMVRLKIRGVHRPAREEFYVVGTGRGSGHMHVNFNVQTRGSGYNSGSFTLSPYGGAKQSIEDTYGSIVVSEEEYQQYQQWLTASGPPVRPAAAGAEESLLAANRANWLKVEKLLYQQIEAHVRHEGLELRTLEFGVGPDYTGAHAEFIAKEEHSLIREVLHKRRSGSAYLSIDSLGDGVWYARSGPYPASTRISSLDLEFLVCIDRKIPRAQYDEWIKKGRQKQVDIVLPDSKWKATLPNGATVEFIGVCENPSAGKGWWGPDGSELGYSPYCNIERHLPKVAGGSVFEMAWRLNWPANTRLRGVDWTNESDVHTRFLSIHPRDRHGALLHGPNTRICAASHAFEKTTEETTLKMAVQLDIDNHQWKWVRFKNISFVSGKNRGFQIELEN